MEKDAESEAEQAPDAAAVEALRCVDEVRELLEAATHGDLAERAAHVKERLDASRESLERASRAARAEGASLSRALLGGEANLREELDEIERRVRENPLGALLAAAGIGLLLGLAISRHR